MERVMLFIIYLRRWWNDSFYIMFRQQHWQQALFFSLSLPLSGAKSKARKELPDYWGLSMMEMGVAEVE